MATITYLPAVAGGTITTSAPLSGDGSSGSPATIAAGTVALLAGATGGQTLTGGTAASDGLTISTTSNGTKGSFTIGSSAGLVYNESTTAFTIGTTAIAYTPTNGWLGIGTATTKINGAGGVGITMAGLATTGPVIEFKGTTAATTTRTCGSFFFYNNTSEIAQLDVTADGATNSGKYVFTTVSGGSFVTALQIFSAGSVVVGAVALATTATDGFLYIPTCAGLPTGVPTARVGTVAMVFNTTANRLMIYDGGWLGATVPGTFV